MAGPCYSWPLYRTSGRYQVGTAAWELAPSTRRTRICVHCGMRTAPRARQCWDTVVPKTWPGVRRLGTSLQNESAS